MSDCVEVNDCVEGSTNDWGEQYRDDMKALKELLESWGVDEGQAIALALACIYRMPAVPDVIVSK